MGWGEEVSPTVSPEELERLRRVDRKVNGAIFSLEEAYTELGIILAWLKKG